MLEIFTTMRKRNGQIWLLKPHIKRLQDIVLNLPIDKIKKSLAKADDNCVVRLRVAPEILVSSRPFEAIEYYTGNPLIKQGIRTFPSYIKLAQNLDQEVMYVNKEGAALEMNRYNIFGLVNGIWHTPSAELPLYAGIMRGELSDFFRNNKIPFKESKPLKLIECESLIFTNAIQGVIPVDQLYGHHYRGKVDWLEKFNQHLSTQWRDL